MQRRRKVIITATVVGAAALAGTGLAVAGNPVDDDATDTPITGAALERASDAALAHTGEGRVTGTEDGDEESRYEVEITLDDGTQIDVQLDEDFQVVGDESDDTTEDDD